MDERFLQASAPVRLHAKAQSHYVFSNNKDNKTTTQTTK